MNKLLTTLVLLGLTVILAPAILVGLGVAWSIIWPIVVVLLIVVGLAAMSQDRQARNNFFEVAKQKGLTRKQAFQYQMYIYKKDPQYMNAAQWNQLTADIDVYADGIKGENSILRKDAERVYAENRQKNLKVALTVFGGMIIFFVLAAISTYH